MQAWLFCLFGPIKDFSRLDQDFKRWHWFENRSVEFLANHNIFTSDGCFPSLQCCPESFAGTGFWTLDLPTHVIRLLAGAWIFISPMDHFIPIGSRYSRALRAVTKTAQKVTNFTQSLIIQSSNSFTCSPELLGIPTYLYCVSQSRTWASF